ncbi:TATA-binding protein-associated factor 172-like [Octopus vulgaris]|uniref:TATA-binding protein-associated factor 172-like n=1 Tax=Octopus vulgaris TaxID=6645 RepID=A0AA36AKT3_OCTVU|nr:TATA-binding protein-associated factor 172-like [Octopus vulgaris]
MTTRLDRLFLLLETGSTPLIRKSAAEQLGEVQKLHPHELNSLLSKVHKFLRNLNWDTRIAAGQAVEAIARNVPDWNPIGLPKEEGFPKQNYQSPGSLLFSHFDINKVLLHGSSLLGSEGHEYDLEESGIDLDDKERLIKQRQLLNKRLGLDMAGTLGIETDSIFNDEDLAQNKMDTNSMDRCKKSVGELVKQQLMYVTSGMSARERNKARRKARNLAKQRSKEAQQSESASNDSEPNLKKVKLSLNEKLEEDRLIIDVAVPNSSVEDCEEWPFESFCEVLMNDLFHNAWEIRHGAATGLREVVKLHGRGAGRATDTPVDQMVIMNQTWLCDLGLRLLCVLALDRFGDFVADEVVAPVRETCAQTLGVVINLLDSDGVHSVVSALLALLAQSQWEVRHGGLLGLKYLLAVRKNMTNELLPKILPCILEGLKDDDDDVRAVAATALVPVCNELVKLLPNEVPKIIGMLWEILLDLDDLTASTNSIMTLLSTLLCYPEGEESTQSSEHSLVELVPRLWPFLRHNIASVRKASLKTFHTLLNLEQNHPKNWLLPLLSASLRHIFQRALLESNPEILTLVEKVWGQILLQVPLENLTEASVAWLGVWFCLLMQPAKIPFDPSYILEAKHRGRDQQLLKNPLRQLNENCTSFNTETSTKQKDFLGGSDCYNESSLEDDIYITRSRMIGAKLLGKLCTFLTAVEPDDTDPSKSLDPICKLMIFHLTSNSALQRFVVAQIIYAWGCENKYPSCTDDLKQRIHTCLNEAIYFDEIAVSFTRMQTECRDFIAGLKQQGLNIEEHFPPSVILTFEQAYALTSTAFDNLKTNLKPKSLQTFEERRSQLQICISQTTQEQQTYSVRVQCSLAMAAIMQNILPEKLNPVIRPLMDCIKKEENREIQMCAANCLARLLKMCLSRTPNPSDKVIKNLCTFLCSDSSITPTIKLALKDSDDQNNEVGCTEYSGILTLTNQQKTPEKNYKNCQQASAASNASVDLNTNENEVNEKFLAIQRVGSECALSTIARLFQDDLPTEVPALWSNITLNLNDNKIKEANSGKLSETELQEIINSLQVLECVANALSKSLLSQVLELLPDLSGYLQNCYTSIRHLACRVVGTLAQLDTLFVMTHIIEVVLPYLGASDNLTQRQGACEVLANVIDRLGVNIIPFIVLLVVPILGRMCDQNEAVRLMATHCFATLICLLPLEAGLSDNPKMKTSLVQQKERERKFLEQLLDNSKIENYVVSVPITAELRKYQQDGVNWLGFLNKYKLHGILCDDMGLGKTLQSICILSCDHNRRLDEFKKTGSPDCAHLPSIVVCPPTLTGHWIYEIEKFISSKYLNPLHYTGPPGERVRLQKLVKKHNLVVVSYDIVRNDIDFFGSIHWNYCILDEGHMIKNGKTKLSKAVKQLCCNHRLILSGTPIQNNVLDLWSLFDFLMPGFLGTEKQFQARYGKPILQSRDAKSTSKEQEAGALAMESLHRQVLPFILRRLKDDVLQDLPPKIMQDYYCDLSPLQVKLYEDFTRSHAKKNVEKSVYSLDEESTNNTKLNNTSTQSQKPNQGTTHIFQALQYLRKVCNHPALVLSSQHPKYNEIIEQLSAQQSSLQDIQHAPKLTALKQLLYDCGIGVTSGGNLSSTTPVVNQHRVLLFCQLKSMLNIVENDLLKAHMPNVTYLRLDGSIPAGSRHSIVNRFNNDPSIDILLLTTHVGGLGLNLTGADTVVFVEHDWNPMKDLQAMDRAHRIGQKKVVNVYRLITRGTLEEKIMGLQKFKMTIANTVISQDNSTLRTMGTDQLLDLFILDVNQRDSDKVNSKDLKNRKHANQQESIRSILDSLGDLWDEKQYESEYNLDTFLKSLNT